MNWISLVFALACATLVMGVIVDARLVKCEGGSVYAVVRLCTPKVPAKLPEPDNFNCRFEGPCS
jgi:hypothetical protein